ncbi:helix-turn-helix domain-containing protein [Oscillospiraceae bacterium 38-13]
MRTLTLEDRRKIELMWRHNASPVKIAAELEISQCTVYTELKRGQETDSAGDAVLDENFRPAYSAERGQTVYQRNLRNRGRRPKKTVERKGADGA